jgi:hypothetical protein
MGSRRPSFSSTIVSRGLKRVEGLNRQLDVDTAHLSNTGTHQDVPEESDDHLIEEPWWATVA